MASSSKRAFLGSCFTATHARAGLWSPKYFENTSFALAKCAMSVRNTVTFITLSISISTRFTDHTRHHRIGWISFSNAMYVVLLGPSLSRSETEELREAIANGQRPGRRYRLLIKEQQRTLACPAGRMCPWGSTREHQNRLVDALSH
eukprot:TRINITY_DN3185_c0_g1_i13.p2 TRINITY_DN3185_c0_g1~~TRINITY_DN3185_c0_g1_i13.p2  ORF type:complete len:147 (-),score=2.37 TRINITY_DN3185_c0_g1_i13:134-574(-)